jgi:hypothetical protein
MGKRSNFNFTKAAVCDLWMRSISEKKEAVLRWQSGVRKSQNNLRYILDSARLAVSLHLK